MDIEIRRTSKHSLHAALYAVSQRTCDTPLKVCLSRGTRSPPALPRDKPPVTVPALQCPLKIPRLQHFLRTQIRPGPSKAPKAQGMIKGKEQTTAASAQAMPAQHLGAAGVLSHSQNTQIV